ncbi:MAG: LacI family DNA-binding transcriptional regulator [Tetrasphaera sp.]
MAAAAGVSRSAVSKVIRNAYGVSPAMRARVEAAIAELDYRPSVAARAMRGASFTLGVEVPGLSSDFFAMVINGANARLLGTPYQLIIAPGLGRSPGERVLDSLLDRQVDGIVAIASELSLASLERVGAQRPLVLLGRHDRSLQFDTVAGDDVAGANLIMDHLFGLGHRRITHVTIKPPSRQSPHAMRRLTYRRRMAGVALDAAEVYLSGDARADSRRIQNLLRPAARPTAIFAGHDALALAVLRECAALGLGPRDVAVVGYDDTPIAGHPFVDLTSVDQHGAQMGELAVEFLLARITGDPGHIRRQRRAPVLRIRGSSAAAGA